MQCQGVRALYLMCDNVWRQVLAESLLRYESLAGYPLQMRERIFAYLVNDLHLLFPEHLGVLLDDEFTSLDFSGMASPGGLKTNKTRDEHVTQVGRLCPRLRAINLSNAVRITNFSLSEGIASCMQVRIALAVVCCVCAYAPSILTLISYSS
jgi:hypothetical protein